MNAKELLEIKAQLEEHDKKLDALMIVLLKVIERVCDLEETMQEVTVVVEDQKFPAAQTNTSYLN